MNIRRMVHWLASTPPLALVVRYLYERRFVKPASRGRFRGVYDDFDAAISSAPRTLPVGYDHDEASRMYSSRPMFPEDYAVLLWLMPLLQGGARVLDFGGHTGGLFDLFRNLPNWPQGVAWTVCDVPAVVQRGLELNSSRSEPHPRFISQLEDAGPAEVFLASGSLQYCDRTITETLARLPVMPDHIIINQTPLHEDLEFVTLQNIGTAYCAYWIRKREQFVQRVIDEGYELVDMWSNPGKLCMIPTHPRQTRPAYYGAYLRRVSRDPLVRADGARVPE